MSKWTKILVSVLGVAAAIAPIFVKSASSTEKLKEVENGVGGAISVLGATGVIK